MGPLSLAARQTKRFLYLICCHQSAHENSFDGNLYYISFSAPLKKKTFKSKETHQWSHWMAPSTTSTSISTFLKSQCEWGSISYSWDGFGILPPFSLWCQSAVLNGYDTSSTLSHSASCGEDQRRKCSMLDVQNSPWLETLSLVLMDTINLLWVLIPIRYSIRVTDLHMEKCRSMALPVETTCADI